MVSLVVIDLANPRSIQATHQLGVRTAPLADAENVRKISTRIDGSLFGLAVEQVKIQSVEDEASAGD